MNCLIVNKEQSSESNDVLMLNRSLQISNRTMGSALYAPWKGKSGDKMRSISNRTKHKKKSS
jgi:hypothetical protein